MNNSLIMQSLPLVAAVLGNKYGVRVEIGGSEASTDGKTIYLPGLPLTCDKTLIGLARGYIDHESAHIRETDFKLLRKAKLTPLEKNICNSIEDWRVENKLAKLFYGCRTNFNWLIRHFFVKENTNKHNAAPMIPDWVLLTVRSWDVADVAKPLDRIESIVDAKYPGLIDQLKSILEEVRTKCATTGDSILYAKKIVDLLKNLMKDSPKKQLEKLIKADANDLPRNMGEVIAEDLEKKSSCDPHKKVQVAVVGKRIFKPFVPDDLKEIKRSSIALRTRLQSLLQATLLKRSRINRRGKLETHHLHKIMTADPRMFVQPEKKQGINTAVHILIDCSGSMKKRIELTSKACFSLAKALESVHGINIGVTAFPAEPSRIESNTDRVGVYPVVKHGEPVHPRFHTRASGCTPMGEATWWVLQQMISLKESRKIILILTDGSPDYFTSMLKAIDHARSIGFEFYGIGIDDNTIESILPQCSCTIRSLSELAPAMFEIMKIALIK